jgi:hypothetical protein
LRCTRISNLFGGEGSSQKDEEVTREVGKNQGYGITKVKRKGLGVVAHIPAKWEAEIERTVIQGQPR